MTKYLVLFFLIIGAQVVRGQTYTWTGTTSSNWATSTNWSPNGVPSTGNTVLIDASVTNSCTLDGNRTIATLGVSAGTLNLGGFTLTCSTAVTFTGGTVNNGTVSSININEVAATTFTGSITLIKTAGNGDNWTGGNTFNTITIINQDPQRIRLAGTNGDTFLGPATFQTTNTGNIDIAYLGTSTFAGTITLTNSSTGRISFGLGGGTSTMTSGSLQPVGFTSGALRLDNFTQNNSTAHGSFNITTFQATGSTLNGNFSMIALDINTLTGNTFNGITSITKAAGGGNDGWLGGNTFGAITITNQSTARIRMATTTADDFNGTATFIRTGTGVIQPAHFVASTFSGDISTTGSTSSIDFAAGTGSVVIDGSTPQTISGDIASKPTIGALTMNTSGTGSLTLNVPVDIGISLVMTSGNIITTSTNILTLTDETVTSSIGSESSYVDGPMDYVLSSNSTTRTTFNFPIGKSTSWRPVVLQVSHTVATAYTYRAEMTNSSARSLGWSLPGTIDTVSNFRYWDVTRYLTSSMVETPSANLGTTGGSDPIITLYFDWRDNVRDGANLSVVKNTTGAPTTWIDIGGTGGPVKTGDDLSGSITSTSSPSLFNSFSRFTLGSGLLGDNDLPVELLSFQATPMGHQVLVEWSTATEIDNDHFLIEKSVNGIDWLLVDQVAGSGDSKAKLDYSTVDFEPYAGLSYYRLTQVDFDGDQEVFNPVSVFNYSEKSEVYPYPNPTTDKIFVASESTLEVFTLTGKNITNTVKFKKIKGGWMVNLTALTKGIYTIKSAEDSYTINLK